MAYLIKQGLPVFCGVKLGMLCCTIGLAEWYKKRNPRFVIMALRLCIAAYLCLYFTSVAIVNHG
jgi:hypothetical protein